MRVVGLSVCLILVLGAEIRNSIQSKSGMPAGSLLYLQLRGIRFLAIVIQIPRLSYQFLGNGGSISLHFSLDKLQVLDFRTHRH